MPRSQGPGGLLFAAMAAALSAGAAPAGDALRRPNVLLILADGLGVECLGCYGGGSYKTPHINRLAASGVRFTSCFATPLDTPSRVELLTGRYGFRTGWTKLIRRDPEADQFLDPSKETTVAQILKSAGSATAVAGTWQLCHFDNHPDHPAQCGFERSCCWRWMHAGEKTARYWNPQVWQDGKMMADLHGQFADDVYADFIVRFLRENRGRPFFAFYPMALAHEPFTVTPDVRTGPGDREARKENKEVRRFPGMVSYLDQVVGRLVAALDELGLRENTVIVFTASTGTDRKVTSIRDGMPVAGGQGVLCERGTHVPLIVAGGGAAAGRVCDDLVDFSDFLPTLAELAGAPLPRGLVIDGRSFAPQTRGHSGRPREWVFCEMKDDAFVRDRRWELFNDGRLFDLQTDPGERHPVPADAGAEADAARKRLQAVLDGLQ